MTGAQIVTGRVTSLVTPCMVRVPVTSYLFWPLATIFVLLKVISGNFSTSKKSAERRCLSRPSSLVSMLVVLIVNSTDGGLRLGRVALDGAREVVEAAATLDTTVADLEAHASEWALSTM